VPDEGGSSFNLMFDVSGGGNVAHYVVRLASPGPGHQTFPDESLSRQVRYLQVVRANSDVPVPEVSFYESDSRWLGTPFFVMPLHRGRAWPSDPPYNFGGWVLDLPAEERARMQNAERMQQALCDDGLRTRVCDAVHQVSAPHSGIDEHHHRA